jgi:uncharacterized protein (TIGR02996 family)
MSVRELELEAAIAADPDDTGAIAVYGDWLAQRGEPLGELIGRELATGAPSLAADIARRRAAIEDALGLRGGVQWLHGLVTAARFVSERGSDPVATRLRRLLAHPASCALQALQLDDIDLGESLASLPASLAGLGVAASRDLGPLAPVPRLVRLRARTQHGTGMAVSPRFLASLASVPLPALEELELDLWGNTILDDVLPLIARADVPALRRLHLRGAPYTGALLRALATCPLAAPVELIDVGNGLDPADALVFAARSMPALRRLRVRRELVGGAAGGLLRDAGVEIVPVRPGRAGDDPDDV